MLASEIPEPHSVRRQIFLFNFQKIVSKSGCTDYDNFLFLALAWSPLMNREVLQEKILTILTDDFEFEQPGLSDNLRDDHGFDSIDAIELLGKIELLLGFTLTREEKEKAMGIRTINDILDYIETIAASRNT